VAMRDSENTLRGYGWTLERHERMVVLTTRIGLITDRRTGGCRAAML